MRRPLARIAACVLGFAAFGAPAQPPAPMPAPAPIPAPVQPPPQFGRGYRPSDPATKAKLYAKAKAAHGTRLELIARFQALPPAFDCRANGWALPVGDQGNCGSCYLYSTCMTASSAFVKAGYGKPDGSFKLSPQYGLDCNDFGGCNGGNGTEVIDWMCQHGFPAESYIDAVGKVVHDYPAYTARTSSCRLVATAKYWKPASWGFCTGDQSDRPPTIQEIKTAMFNHGVLNVAIDAGGQFSNGTGTITALGNNIDHEIQVVAWDDAKDGGAFLLQNQWNTDWGVGGYRWVTYKAATRIVDWFWVSATPLPPPDPPPTPPIPPKPPVPPTPPPKKVVTLTLTPEQVQSVIQQSGAVTIRGDMTLKELMDAFNKAAKASPGPVHITVP